MNVIPEDVIYKPSSHLSSNSSTDPAADDEMDQFEEIKLNDPPPLPSSFIRKKGMVQMAGSGGRPEEEFDFGMTRKASKVSDRGFFDDRDFERSINDLDDDILMDQQRYPRRSSHLRKVSDIGFYSDMDEDEYRLRKMSLDEGFRSAKNSIVPVGEGLFRDRTPSLVDELLSEIYTRFGDLGKREDEGSLNGGHFSESHSTESDGGTEYSTTSSAHLNPRSSFSSTHERSSLLSIDKKPDRKTLWGRFRGKSHTELRQEIKRMDSQIKYSMSQLTRQVKRRDQLRHRRERQYNLLTAILQASSQKRSQDTKIRFSLDPSPGDPGYNQWKDAMKMVARLPEGVPVDFRRKLWLTLADKYLSQRSVEWKKAERFCFNEWSNPDDDELGIQIVKDLHRTGCSLFCGEEAEVHQLMLKRVLLAYARWNKAIGYCQGFNMLGAIILEVMDKAESDALKVMIYMIEGVLPEFYFTNNLRGLSVDMAVFRDLLKLRLPRLSKHLDTLQEQAREGMSYEPPLTNVFTMQWFLTLFSTCLPRYMVLRVWDLILLEGNEVLLRTALAIWQSLEEQIIPVSSADEFYSLMGQLSGEMLLMGQEDSNNLIKNLVDISPFPFSEIEELREKYTYNITPWSHGLAVAKRGLKILYSDDEDLLDEDDEKIAVAATFGISAVFGQKKGGTSPLRSALSGPQLSLSSANPSKGPSGQNVDKDRLSVDISSLRKQYSKLRQRQKQAHIILTSAWSKQGPKSENSQGSMSTRNSLPQVNQSPIVMNHLLLGKKPLVGSKPRKGPPPGAVPAPRSPHMSMQRNPPSKATKCTKPQPDLLEATPSEPPLPSVKSRSRAESENQEEFVPSESENSIEDSDTATTTTHVASLLDSEDERSLDSLSSKSNSDFVHKLFESFDKTDSRSPQELFPPRETPTTIKENSDLFDQILREKSTELNGGTAVMEPRHVGGWEHRHFSVDFSAVKVSQSAALMRRTHSLGGEDRAPPGPKQPFNPFPNRTQRSPRSVGIKLGLYK